MEDSKIASFDLTAILDWAPESVFDKAFPYVADVEDTIRLKRIVYRALYHLKITQNRPKNTLLAAWEDLFTLRDWFIQVEVGNAIDALKDKLEKTDLNLAQYTDVDQYQSNIQQGIALHHLDLVDILRDIIMQIGVLSDAPCQLKSTHFTNAEFLCVAALYKVSMALKKLQKLHVQLNHAPTAIDRSTLWDLKQATNNTLEAQLAIELANLYDKLTSSDFEAAYKAMLSEQQRHRAIQGNRARWNKHKQRREKAWELFHKVKKDNPALNDTKIIARIVDALQRFSDEIGIERLKIGSEEESIYKMIYQKRRELKNKNPK